MRDCGCIHGGSSFSAHMRRLAAPGRNTRRARRRRAFRTYARKRGWQYKKKRGRKSRKARGGTVTKPSKVQDGPHSASREPDYKERARLRREKKKEAQAHKAMQSLVALLENEKARGKVEGLAKLAGQKVSKEPRRLDMGT